MQLMAQQRGLSVDYDGSHNGSNQSIQSNHSSPHHRTRDTSPRGFDSSPRGFEQKGSTPPVREVKDSTGPVILVRLVTDIL